MNISIGCSSLMLRYLLFPFRKFSVLCVGAFLLLSLPSCEYWEDWCDGDKPPPPDPITPQYEARTTHTREEAMSLVCNKLIMKFSMMPEKPVISCRSSDNMARGVAVLLRKANVINLNSSSPDCVCSLESAPAEPGSWHPVAVLLSSGKVILDETIFLVPDENGVL